MKYIFCWLLLLLSVVLCAGQTMINPNTQINLKNYQGVQYSTPWQTTPTSNNGIAMSLAQCASLPYACQLLAPALYSAIEMPTWSRINFSNFAIAQHSVATGSAYPVTLLDQRNGANFVTIVNPYLNAYPLSTNPFVAWQLKVDYTGVPPSTPSPFQNYSGMNLSVTQTQNGVLSQAFDFQHQSTIDGLQMITTRNTSEAGSGIGKYEYCTAPGDCTGESDNVQGPAGASHQFDEGMALFSDFVTPTINIYRGTLTGTPATGSTALVVSPASPSGGSAETISGSQGENRWALDTQSGKVSALTATTLTDDVQPFTDTIPSCYNGFACNWFSQLTMSAGITPSTAWGTITTAITVPGGALIPGTQTVSVTLASGSGAIATGIACLASELGPSASSINHFGNFEIINITATGAGTFTATMHKNQPAGATFWQGGQCGKFAELAGSSLPSGSAWSNGEYGGTTSYPVRFAWPILGSVDGTNMILWTGRNSFGPLDSAWGLGGSPNKGINVFQGAEVYKVVGANNDTTDNNFALSPNNAAWASGDTVEESQFPAQVVSAGVWSMSNFLPHTGKPSLLIQLLGRVENSDAGIQVQNFASPSSYAGHGAYGGTWAPPAAPFIGVGLWDWLAFLTGQPDRGLIGWSGGLANQTTRIVNPGGDWTADHFDYTQPAGGGGSGGIWTFFGKFVASFYVPFTTTSNVFPIGFVPNSGSTANGIFDIPCTASGSCGYAYNVFNFHNAGGGIDGNRYDPVHSQEVRFWGNNGTYSVVQEWDNVNGAWPGGGRTGGWYRDVLTSSGTVHNIFGEDNAGTLWFPGGGSIPATSNPISVPVANTPYTGLVTCSGGQHISSLNIVNGVIVAAPTCS